MLRLNRSCPVEVLTRTALPIAPWAENSLAMTFVPAAGASTFISVQPRTKRPPDSGTMAGHEVWIRPVVALNRRPAEAPLASNTLASGTNVSKPVSPSPGWRICVITKRPESSDAMAACVRSMLVVRSLPTGLPLASNI